MKWTENSKRSISTTSKPVSYHSSEYNFSTQKDVSMRGIVMLYGACLVVLRFGGVYYAKNKANYTVEQQAGIEAMLEAAQTLAALIKPVILP
jgi:hypothetical protein